MKPRPFFAYLRSAALLLALLTPTAHALPQAMARAHAGPAAKVENAAPLAHTRLVKTGDDTYAYQLAILTLTSTGTPAPDITLVSAIHIGSPEYYAQLQTILDAQPLLLFEGISKHPDTFKKRATAGTPDTSLYARLARATGLATQLESLNYDRAHFKNADLSPEALRNILIEEGKLPDPEGAEARQALARFDWLLQVLSGGSNDPALLLIQGLLGLVEKSPQMRATVLLMLTQTGQQPRAGAASNKQFAIPPRLQKLILEDRNKAAIDILREELARPDPPEKIGLFYGAAHLTGIEETLINEMGYHLADTAWITAFVIHPRAAKLSPGAIKKLTAHAVSAPDQPERAANK